MLSRGATIISGRTTFRSAMTVMFMTLALRAAISPSVRPCVVDCQQTCFCKNNQQVLPKIIQKDQILVSSKRKSSIVTAVNWTFPHSTSNKNTIQVQNTTETYDPNTTDITNMQFLFSKTFPKIINILTVIKILKRIKRT
jgi:hypothetical protein